MASPPVVDTFEHDIAEEIRHKEASVADIATAVGDVGNNPKDTSSSNSFILIGIVLFLVLCAIIGLLTMGYLYYSGKYNPFASQPTPKPVNVKQTKPPVSLSSLFPTLQEAIGIYVTGIEKNASGYNITISSYSPVFSYIIKNENMYKDEVGMNVNPGKSVTQKKEAVPQTAVVEEATTSAVVTASTTQTASSSLESSSTTIDIGISEDEVINASGFTDVTIDNQNMRVGESLFGTVVYAFVGTNHLVFSSSTDGILLIRNNILHK